MAQTVTHFPPSINTETRVKICQLVAQMEAEALHEQNQARASGFPFHNFYSSSFDYRGLLFLSRQCSASTLPVICSNVVLSKPKQLIHVATRLVHNRHQRKEQLRIERKGEAVQMTNLTPTFPSFLKHSSSSDWYIYIFGVWLLLIE